MQPQSKIPKMSSGIGIPLDRIGFTRSTEAAQMGPVGFEPTTSRVLLHQDPEPGVHSMLDYGPLVTLRPAPY